jgi:methionyl-tRNA synthetase
MYFIHKETNKMGFQELLNSVISTSDTTALYNDIASYLGISLGVLYILLIIISIWSIVWKGIALYKSARQQHIIWFVVLLIINTVGILEILYIYIFSEMGNKSKSSPKQIKKKK